ncbi:hypothetical protein EYC84_001410 [Monilinia fructicola]|uniref:Uncharacterized protein n=1 Tax=Monilinia fructicola TaxID=38448 RepID=A0A5M9JRV1_MONFR|nr:hypothetical protein EYC84_001410 [Monilinia fructicola]
MRSSLIYTTESKAKNDNFFEYLQKRNTEPAAVLRNCHLIDEIGKHEALNVFVNHSRIEKLRCPGNET